jgi:hypothetical protein
MSSSCQSSLYSPLFAVLFPVSINRPSPQAKTGKPITTDPLTFDPYRWGSQTPKARGLALIYVLPSLARREGRKHDMYCAWCKLGRLFIANRLPWQVLPAVSYCQLQLLGHSIWRRWAVPPQIWELKELVRFADLPQM